MDECLHNGTSRYVSTENYLIWWYCEDCHQNYYRYIEGDGC